MRTDARPRSGLLTVGVVLGWLAVVPGRCGAG
jgi:hypothetical protein